MGDRLGKFPEGFIAAEKGTPRLWLHAVSVGEVMATQPFVSELKKAFPQLELYFSTVTPTGFRVASKIFAEQKEIKLFYFPLDISAVTKKVVQLIRPDLIILMETELWPNLILSARREGIPVSVINGRFSPRSFRSYYRFKTLLRPITKKIRFAAVQNENYKRRFIRLGFNRDRIFVTGTMKYDIQPTAVPGGETAKAWKARIGFPENSKVWIAASTHPGEEKTCLEVFNKLRRNHPNLYLVLVPRKIERAKSIARLVREKKFSLKTAVPLEGVESTFRPDVYLLNTIGELAKIYPFCDYVFMGGSLVPHGGQNPLEATCWGKPVLFGPFVFNFKDVYDVLKESQGGVLVHSRRELRRILASWLENPLEAERIGKIASETMESLRGASKRNCELVISEFQKRKNA